MNDTECGMNNRQGTSKLINYEIINELGHGAFSTVYKVKVTNPPAGMTNNSYCVLKKIDLKKTGNVLTEEVKILKILEHPHIVKFYDSFIEDNFMYILMEYCEYGDLYTMLNSCKRNRQHISEDILWDISYQLLLGLEYLHSQRVIHRDIKLLNIFMNKDKVVKIGDLGMSTCLNDNDCMLRARVGTPLYLAPELVKKESYNYKVDVWSLGCSIYHLATFNPPFNEENLIRLGNAIVYEQPQSLPVEYSEKFQAFVLELMCKDHVKRVSSTNALFLIPHKVKKKYDEKFKIESPLAKTKITMHEIAHTVSNYPLAPTLQSTGHFINENTMTNFRSAGIQFKNKIKFRPERKRIEIKQINNISKNFSNTQESFRPSTKEMTNNGKIASSQIMTCNNFYNINVNVYKIQFNKKHSSIKNIFGASDSNGNCLAPKTQSAFFNFKVEENNENALTENIRNCKRQGEKRETKKKYDKDMPGFIGEISIDPQILPIKTHRIQDNEKKTQLQPNERECKNLLFPLITHTQIPVKISRQTGNDSCPDFLNEINTQIFTEEDHRKKKWPASIRREICAVSKNHKALTIYDLK